MAGIAEGRVVVITGAARGLGRAHALEFAAEGARVLVNDLGVERDGSGGASEPAQEVVAEIRAMGGEAEANAADVADWDQAEAMIAQAVDTWGRLDTLVCNAGFLRDRMLANMSESEWDAIMRVHLKGHFAPARHAVAHWRDRSKAGEMVQGRVINTSSGAGLLGSIGQGNYAAAKAGVAAMTIQQAAEWGRYGVMVNAIAPDARTRMTAGIMYEEEAPEGWDEKDPANASPLVVWLGSDACDVTGRVFEIAGGALNVCDGWQHGHVVDVGRKFAAAEVGEAVHASIAASPDPAPVYGAS
ncbi:MAG: SDR family NAD(P)-dependent oxidoreductase [Acidimicrobiia bacterium]|nr:SDR family NAD(P)-dependent oxidoreductase [Acidimicrobiia bacterium]MYG57456.1 SDR family NAD(P)-dependent oxidoreductase [Acidimicrobiia bacterium]MYJ31333.1 SDR family NAD(P)-dependent oxidoreductase [Acidimicrobiia bacterium]MYL10222.1 SDR family NAD(P)-dependent oxidoreductase [Acidimicrobiia bacterium]